MDSLPIAVITWYLTSPKRNVDIILSTRINRYWLLNNQDQDYTDNNNADNDHSYKALFGQGLKNVAGTGYLRDAEGNDSVLMFQSDFAFSKHLYFWLR